MQQEVDSRLLLDVNTFFGSFHNPALGAAGRVDADDWPIESPE